MNKKEKNIARARAAIEAALEHGGVALAQGTLRGFLAQRKISATQYHKLRAEYNL